VSNHFDGYHEARRFTRTLCVLPLPGSFSLPIDYSPREATTGKNSSVRFAGYVAVGVWTLFELRALSSRVLLTNRDGLGRNERTCRPQIAIVTLRPKPN